MASTFIRLNIFITGLQRDATPIYSGQITLLIVTESCRKHEGIVTKTTFLINYNEFVKKAEKKDVSPGAYFENHDIF